MTFSYYGVSEEEFADPTDWSTNIPNEPAPAPGPGPGPAPGTGPLDGSFTGNPTPFFDNKKIYTIENDPTDKFLRRYTTGVLSFSGDSTANGCQFYIIESNTTPGLFHLLDIKDNMIKITKASTYKAVTYEASDETLLFKIRQYPAEPDIYSIQLIGENHNANDRAKFVTINPANNTLLFSQSNASNNQRFVIKTLQ